MISLRRSAACVQSIFADGQVERSSDSDLVFVAYNSAVSVSLGSSRLLASGQLKGRKVGIVSNPASVDANYVHVVDALMNAPGVTVGALFGPQHGFRSDVQDNMIETPHGNDCRRKVPVFSLYSETREPTAEMLRHVDTMVVDLQDIGARIYTYIYTMANCLRACARHKIDIIVCDRPNPIGGLDVEGPMLVPGNESFVGQFPIPDASRHDDRRAGAVLQRVLRDQRAARGHPDGRLESIDVFRSDGPAVRDAVAEHPDARQRDRLPGHGVVRRHERIRSARDDAGRSSWWARRGSRPSVSPTR